MYCSALMPKRSYLSHPLRHLHGLMNVDLSISLCSKIWRKSGFLWKAKVDGSDVRNGVQIRKGKTGRVLFWFSVQTQQQSCDKDEMMLADEGRVIRFQNKNHSSKH